MSAKRIKPEESAGVNKKTKPNVSPCDIRTSSIGSLLGRARGYFDGKIGIKLEVHFLCSFLRQIRVDVINAAVS